MKIELTKTKRLYPAIWEEGGAVTSSGDAKIICGSNFEPLTPIYVKNHGHRACGQHALFVAKKGMHIIYVRQKRRVVEEIKIFRIKEIVYENDNFIAYCDVVNSYEEGEWDSPIEGNEALSNAINSAIDKAKCYHCRSPHYALDPLTP